MRGRRGGAALKRGKFSKAMKECLLDEDGFASERTDYEYSILSEVDVSSFDIDPRVDSIDTIRALQKLRADPAHQKLKAPIRKEKVEQYVKMRSDRRSVFDDPTNIGKDTNTTKSRYNRISMPADHTNEMALSAGEPEDPLKDFYFIAHPMLTELDTLGPTISEIYGAVKTKEEFAEYVLNSAHHSNIELRHELFISPDGTPCMGDNAMEYLRSIGWNTKILENDKNDTRTFTDTKTDQEYTIFNFYYYGKSSMPVHNDYTCSLHELKITANKGQAQTNEDNRKTNSRHPPTYKNPEFCPELETQCLFTILLVICMNSNVVVRRMYAPVWVYINPSPL